VGLRCRGSQTSSGPWSWRAGNAVPPVTPIRSGSTSPRWTAGTSLEDAWPGEVVVHDPHSGEIRGHRQLRRFVRRSHSVLAERRARVETLTSTAAGDRATVELLAHLTLDGRQLAWPVAVVAESPSDRSVVFRSYFSQRALDGGHHLRPPVLEPGPAHPSDVVGRYQAALAAGE
jgi:hypothetical protein